MKNVAICPGSFDPVTNGHLDIIRRAADTFEKVIVLIVINPDKTPAFSPAERVEMLSRVTQDIPNVEVRSHEGLLTEYMKEMGISIIVKGLRAVSDYEYEWQMAMANKKLLPSCDTFFLVASNNNMFLSSSLVKQLARFGGDISGLVPPQVLGDIEDRLSIVKE